ncbi:Ribokinase-like protein [Umbelopsis sp. PMI_123]|nr:Ribokinase-like protein [Umbelopsis sp. PMI_123]
MTTTDIFDSQRVLSIQSHVVSGYAGNKAATFPLQTLGYDVDVLNILQFSNHTGYPSWGGKRIPPEEIQDIFDGLKKNELMDDYTHILTGYIGNAATLETCARAIREIKERRKGVIYVCDPVMGDDGNLYVSSEMIPLYRSIAGLADVITPNQTEAEALANTKIETLSDAKEAIRHLHQLGVPHVVITTVHLPQHDIPKQLITDPNSDKALICIGSSILENGQTKQFLISFPTYHGYFTGTGDMFSALVVARLTEQLNAAKEASEDLSPLAKAIFKVVLSLNVVTEKTWKRQKEYVKLQKGEQAPDIEGKPDSAKLIRQCELMVIQGKEAIETPHLFSHDQIKVVMI